MILLNGDDVLEIDADTERGIRSFMTPGDCSIEEFARVLSGMVDFACKRGEDFLWRIEKPAERR